VEDKRGDSQNANGVTAEHAKVRMRRQVEITQIHEKKAESVYTIMWARALLSCETMRMGIKESPIQLQCKGMQLIKRMDVRRKKQSRISLSTIMN